MFNIQEVPLSEGMDIILKHKLHYSKQSGIKYEITRAPECITNIIIAYSNDIPIGCAIVSNGDDYSIMIYIKTQFKRMGLGTLLAQKAKAFCRFPIVDKSNSSKQGFWDSAL